MRLLSPSSATSILCSSHSSYCHSTPRLHFHNNKNAANTNCCINEGKIAMSAYGKKGLLPVRHSPFLALDVSTVENPHFLATSMGPSPRSFSVSRWNLCSSHILLLSIIACTVALSTSWLFFSAIPTLLAFRRAAESLEKLFDSSAEELPDTMAALRLSGMEISDLTMELSDLGQDITQGVRSSTRAVRVAEERLRHLTTMNPPVPIQDSNEMERPQLAKRVRDLREGIVRGRALFGAVLRVSQFSRRAWNFFAVRGQKRC